MVTVEEFIAAEAAKPFGWGATDCATTADRWVQLVRGISPMDALGRRHRDEVEARAWMEEFGGVAIAFNRAMRAARISKTTQPKPGDLGLVIFENRMCIAIHAGSFWFSRHEDGLVGAPLGNVWKAWAI